MLMLWVKELILLTCAIYFNVILIFGKLLQFDLLHLQLWPCQDYNFSSNKCNTEQKYNKFQDCKDLLTFFCFFCDRTNSNTVIRLSRTMTSSLQSVKTVQSSAKMRVTSKISNPSPKRLSNPVSILSNHSNPRRYTTFPLVHTLRSV